MILLSELLDEDGEAAQQAKQMGLISKGWGRWADPRTGKVTHKTDGGQLVAVDPQQQEPSGGQEPDLDKVAQDLDKSKNTDNVAQDLDKKEPNFTRDTGPGESPSGQEANKQRIDSFLDKVSTVKNKDKAAKLIHNKIQHIDKQWTGVFDTTPKDPMYKNYGDADFEDDLYNLEKGYKKIVGKPYNAKDFADKGTAVAVRNTDDVVKNLSDKDLEKRMNKLSDYMDDLKRDMRGATGNYKEKYEKATKDHRKAFKVYHDELQRRQQAGNKYDDPKYKKGDWWDDPELQDEPDDWYEKPWPADWHSDPDFRQKLMAKTAADRAAKKAKRDAEFKKDNEKWADARAKKFQSRADHQRASDMSTGNPKHDKFLNTVEDKVRNLDVNVGDTYSPEEFAKKSGISPDQQKAYHKLYRSTETWEVPAFELIPGKDGKTSVFIPDPQDV